LPRTFDRTAVELSAEGLRMARERLGEGADEIRWIEGDVLRTELGGPFDLWHDRAVFHFLLEEEERRLYRQAVARSLRPGGHMILATFAEDGPERCSGLPVRRYSPAQLALEWEGLLEPIDAIRHVHRTPTGREQRYVYALMRRPAAED
ncbi:MAG: class I SAM-dependent methyltransferase, partial [Myxococcales bacterium]|nr:class I SAM-dependent methyltransferase [Myxococcales bacterium]